MMLLMRMQISAATMENSIELLKKLTYEPAILLLGIYLKETIIQKDKCTPMSTAALFTISKTWKQLKCPLTGEWTVIYTYNGIILRHKRMK